MHRRSESRNKRRTAGLDLDKLTGDRSHRHGNDGHLRKQTKASKKAVASSSGNGTPPEENFIDIEFRSTSSKKAARIHLKELIDRDMSKELVIRRSSPGLVARLMGLDTLPPSVATYQQNERIHSRQKTPYVVFQEKYAAYGGYSRRTRTNEYQECKDVFEVTEKLKAEKHHNKPIPKVMSSTRKSENDTAFIKQKLMDEMYLAVENAYEHSKEHHEALEGQGSNEDHFLNFLEEPNPLFKMHLQDLKCSSLSPNASDITILKSSKGTKHDRSELSCKSEKYAHRSSHMQKGDKNISRQSFTCPLNQSHNGHGQPLPCKLSDLQHSGQVRELHPAQIVILKPSLEKAWGNVKTVPSPRSTQIDHTSRRRHKKVPTPRTSEFNAERGEKQKLSESVEVMGHNTRSPRKIARKITGQMRSTGSSCTREGSASKLYGYISNGNSFGMSGIKSLNSEFFGSTSDHLNNCSDNRREARNCLSERWKTAHLVQEGRPVGRRSSTLGEFFASSDRETPEMALYTTVVQNVSNGKVARDEESEKRHFLLDISSKNGWIDGWSGNLPSSQPDPASSLVYQNYKSRRGNIFGESERSCLKNVLDKSQNDANLRKRRTSSLKNFRNCHNDQIYSDREQIQTSEREIHVNSEELRDRIHGRQPRRIVSVAGKGNASMVPEFRYNSFSGRGQLGNSSQERYHWKLPLVIDGQEHKEPAPLTKDAMFSGRDWNVLRTKETALDNPQVDLLSYQGHVLESSSQLNFKEVDELNHLHVLEPLRSEEEKSTDSVDKINSDLQELWTQPKLLKLESSDTHADDLDVPISSEDYDGGDHYSLLKFGDILESFRDDEDRDFSYLLDLLVDSGLRHASQDGPSLEYSVGSEVFEKLETKYNMLLSWSRPERKLLFDLISSILIDLMAPSCNLHSEKPRWQLVFAGEDLVEKVWQILVKRRKEPSSKLNEQVLDLRWLDLRDDVDIVGKNLEKMMVEDLMEELCHQLLLSRSSNDL